MEGRGGGGGGGGGGASSSSASRPLREWSFENPARSLTRTMRVSYRCIAHVTAVGQARYRIRDPRGQLVVVHETPVEWALHLTRTSPALLHPVRFSHDMPYPAGAAAARLGLVRPLPAGATTRATGPSPGQRTFLVWQRTSLLLVDKLLVQV